MKHRAACLPEEGDHLPFRSNLFASKLLLVPCLRAAGCCTKIYHGEYQAQENGRVQELARGRRNKTHAEVHEALSRIMWADDSFEPSFTWQGVLLEACQVGMTLMLLLPSQDEDCDSKGHRERGLPFELVDFPGMKDSTFT